MTAGRAAVNRKIFRVVCVAAGVLSPLAGAYVWFFCGPFRFVETAIRHDDRAKLTASAAWRSYTPLEAADEYLHSRGDPSDRPKLAELETGVDQSSGGEAVVTITNRRCGDDCVSAQCDRVTLRRHAGGWVPVKHEVTWQSRNSFGWSTKTPS